MGVWLAADDGPIGMDRTSMTSQATIAATAAVMPANDKERHPDSAGPSCSSEPQRLSNARQQDAQRLRRLARRIDECTPRRLRWILRPFAYGYELFNEIRPRFWIAESQHSADGAKIMVLCAAQERDRRYLLRRFLGDTYRERCIGRRWLWEIPRVTVQEGRGCCLVAVKTLGRFRRLLKPEQWFYVPGWVAGDVELPLDPGVLRMETVRSDLRKIGRNALQYHVTQDLRQLRDFYDHMYVPYIAQAHGDSAVIMPYESMKAAFPHCELLLVMQADEPIAGLLISYSDAVPRLWSLGVRDADRDLVRAGAIGALYHFSLRHLCEKGYARANLGLSRAFLHDGVLQYKKKLGMRLSRAGREWFAVRTLDDSKATRVLLRETPLIVERDGLLCGLICVDASADQLSEEDWERLDRQFFMPGLSRLLVVPLGGSCDMQKIPARLAARIAVCSASDILRDDWYGKKA